jgi:hypothetical protein
MLTQRPPPRTSETSASNISRAQEKTAASVGAAGGTRIAMLAEVLFMGMTLRAVAAIVNG